MLIQMWEKREDGDLRKRNGVYTGPDNMIPKWLPEARAIVQG